MIFFMQNKKVIENDNILVRVNELISITLLGL